MTACLQWTIPSDAVLVNTQEPVLTVVNNFKTGLFKSKTIWKWISFGIKVFLPIRTVFALLEIEIQVEVEIRLLKLHLIAM